MFTKFYCKTNFFFVVHTTPASNSLLCFRRSLLERIYKLIMTIDDKIADEKLQCDTNRKAAELSTLS